MIATVLDTGPIVTALNTTDRRHANRVATLDHRHFGAVKPAHVPALTLVP